MRGWAVLLALALAACGDTDTDTDTVAARGTSLVVEQDGRRMTLTCDPPGGDHPRPEAACAALSEQALAPLPSDVACTQVYGGPETATVRGTYRGAPVDLALSRTDGCRIAQWDRLGPLLGRPS